MIEIIPFMLFLIEWHPDRAGEIDLQRQPILFTTREECERTGAALTVQRTVTSQDGKRYKFVCTEIPKSEEFRDAFDRDDRRALERDTGPNQ